ncbi:hypothetical protein QFC21_003917 [Naganishia friedmannii]|uniref:Uncharacterized protein n=1 Tax=Naganishia friedmannii TaxID=89922 RepID=A0ACC2VLX4_9TREE|nr:hypothetical protein QFC21_003917 [Naganishia friedmannii]
MAMLIQYIYEGRLHASLKGSKEPDALRLGILSSAMIDAAAVVRPAESHPGLKIVAIASRELSKAQDGAKKFGIPKAYGSYEEMLDDPEIDAIYISVPNGLHAEWAIKSMRAGKHVLIEKPLCANVDEAKAIFEVAQQTGRVALEAFHWQFHPAAHVVKSYVDSGKYGKVLKTSAMMVTPKNSMPSWDIRWKYDLAGGATMDETYTISATRYFTNCKRATVVSANARPYKKDPRIDSAMDATLKIENDKGDIITSEIHNDLDQPNLLVVIPRLWELPSIRIELEKATIYYYNFMMPHLYMYVAITDKATGSTTYQKHYNYGPKWKTTGETWWSTYRYMLEAFVDRCKGEEPVHWVPAEDSIAQMQVIDDVYTKSGLGRRTGSVVPA